jgi:hypothetical protein
LRKNASPYYVAAVDYSAVQIKESVVKLAKTFVEVDTGAREPAETTIKGFMPIGTVAGSGSVAVTAYEVVIPRKELAFHGVRFEITGGGDYPSESIATIAAENAELLIKSIDQLAGASISTDRFALSEVEAVVDDLKIVVFNTDRGRLHAAVSSGTATCHLMKQSDLFELSKLVSLALDHLRRQGAVT